jgi:hypothetical protein
MQVRLCLFILTLIFLPVLADDTPKDGVTDSPTLLNKDFAQWCRVGQHTFHLERHSLAEISHLLGKGTVVNTSASDPGNADPLWAVAYRVGQDVIQFEADGDMGGPTHILTGITVVPRERYPSASRLPSIPGPIEFEFGRMGMPLQKLMLLLGKADVHGASVSYSYQGHATGPKVASQRESVVQGQKSGIIVFDVTAYLRAWITDGNLSSVEMTHVTTF